MNIVILGAGEVGYHIANRLATEGNNVSVVDQDEERLQHPYWSRRAPKMPIC